MNEQKMVEAYFYDETKDFVIKELRLEETKYSYFDTIRCYYILTNEKKGFYIFVGDTTPMNIYSIREGEALDECYYKHVGFMAEYSSQVISRNFILNFIKDFSIFPILDRRLGEIESEITLDKNANQLCGIANQIRDCYLNLTDYLMNKLRTQNPNFKNDNFTDNLEEFLRILLPGKQSETRRNVINSIAQKGWKLNSELIHKDSTTVFDVLISFNICQLTISTISNLIVGNKMPFNKIKCPICKSEETIMQKVDDQKEYRYICQYCQNSFNVSLNEIIKEI